MIADSQWHNDAFPCLDTLYDIKSTGSTGPKAILRLCLGVSSWKRQSQWHSHAFPSLDDTLHERT